MKLILVFSDTHGDITDAKKVIQQFPQAEVILHLGDYVGDAGLLQKMFPEKTVIGVSGNCDTFGNREAYPDERTYQVGGKTLLLVHGHRLGVKDGYEKLVHRAKTLKADLTLFGHTHLAVDTQESGCHLLNPGSLTFPKNVNYGTYALVEIGSGLIETRLMEV